MKVLIEHVFAGVDCDAYERLYFDEPFNEALGRLLQLGRTVLRFERTPDRIVRHVCFDAVHEPESPTAQAFGSSRASFVEELEYDVRARRATYRTIPSKFADRMTSTGTIELSSAAGGVRRTVRGEVKVSLFGFGRLVERMIVAEIEKSYAATSKFTTEWIAQHAR
jgi:hypothetical protein